MKLFSAGSAARDMPLAGRTAFFLAVCAALLCLTVSCVPQKEAVPRIAPAADILPALAAGQTGAVGIDTSRPRLAAVSALAWLDAENSPGGENFPDDERFASVSDDGLIRIWDVYSGRPVKTFRAGDEGAEAVAFPEAGSDASLPVFSRDGTKKIFAAPDGAVCLADAASEKVIARYYGFEYQEGASPEWISVTPEGFYHASFEAPARFTAETEDRRYRLDQLAGALFRPDLFKARVLSAFRPADERPKEAESDAGRGLGSAPPETPGSLFREDRAPPRVSLSIAENDGTSLKIKITARKGGAGSIALYRRSSLSKDGGDIPAGLFDTEKAAEKKYSEKNALCYEITLLPGAGEIGVSAFNKSNTVESERVWIVVPGAPSGQFPARESSALVPDMKASRPDSITEAVPDLRGRPALKVLLASGDNSLRENTDGLGGLFSRQAEGDLYSAVEVRTLSGGDFTTEGLGSASAGLFGGAKKNDVHVLYLRGFGKADALGNLYVLPRGEQGGISTDAISGEALLQTLLNYSSNSLVLMDLLSGTPDDAPGAGVPEVAVPETGALETALYRFRQRLGPRAMLALFGRPEADDSFVQTLAEKLRPDFLNAELAGLVGTRYVNAGELLNYAAENSAGREKSPLVFLPRDNFDISDNFINAGELKFQTMASGMLKIDRVDKTPVPLVFGDTMSRRLPAGSYIIDMIYRNGYRETRTVEVRKKDSAWVIFTYTPPLLVGDFSLALSRAGGINTSELNPANYQKINKEAMESMGMAPYYVAFLSGEKFYREGEYDRAIGEYTRAVSLKSDYADAYISRGNARRRKGELDLAVEDYTRALRLKSGSADVYNYRGFIYAGKGDLNRAIADYTQAIRYRADYADAYFNRAHAYAKRGEWEKAIADYTQVIRLEPSNAAAYQERGASYRGKGEEAGAAADYAAAQKLRTR